MPRQRKDKKEKKENAANKLRGRGMAPGPDGDRQLYLNMADLRLRETTGNSGSEQPTVGASEPGLKPVFDRTLSATEDFLCGCCFDLMVQPTTLTCGHSFCRLCIANWYLASKKLECPQCSTAWTGNPQVNITLKKILERMYAEAVKERSRETLTHEARNNIAQFDKALTATRKSDSTSAHGQGFCGGTCFAVAVVIICIVSGVIYLSWYWRSSDQDLQVHKQCVQWSVDDVTQWLTDLGPWTQAYVHTVQERNIVGRLVLELDETNIVDALNVTDPLHKKALLNSIRIMREAGVKPPFNLWEFKALHPGWTMFLLYGLKDYPRTIFLYLYMFEYQTMFEPFIHTVCPVSDLATNFDFTYPPSDLSSDQWAEFLPKFLFLPYLLVAEFTWSWTDIHWWTARFVLVNCLVLTLTETNTVSRYLFGGARLTSLTDQVRTIFTSYLYIWLFILFLPLVPSFVRNFLFYKVIFFSPYQAAAKLFQSWRRRGAAGVVH